jgi:hypothetical protein
MKIHSADLNSRAPERCEPILAARYIYAFKELERLDTELTLHRGLDQPELDTLHYPIKAKTGTPTRSGREG